MFSSNTTHLNTWILASDQVVVVFDVVVFVVFIVVFVACKGFCHHLILIKTAVVVVFEGSLFHLSFGRTVAVDVDVVVSVHLFSARAAVAAIIFVVADLVRK